MTRTRIAGILNVTPDSFYELSRTFIAASRVETEKAVAARVSEMLSQGADMIDVGACSTRPGSDAASEELETARLDWSMPVVMRLAGAGVSVSVDTFRPSVAERMLDTWGSLVINDVSGGSDEMYQIVSRYDAAYVLTCSRNPGDDDVMTDMISFFDERLERLSAYGADNVILDPGIGFGKTLTQNYQVMSNLSRLMSLGLPVMVGVSRKSLIYRLLGITPDESLTGTTVLNTVAAMCRADWLRVHDVAEAVQVVKITEELLDKNTD